MDLPKVKKMKKLFLLALLFSCAGTASAQTRPRYVFDNFSTGNVQTASSPAPLQASRKTSKSLVKKTAQQRPANLPVNGGYADTGVRKPAGTFRSRTGGTLSGYSTGDNII